MKNSEVIYCVECNSLLLRGEVQMVFKTGFYRTTIPLGHCKDCAGIHRVIEMDIDLINKMKYGFQDESLYVSYHL